MAPARSQAMLLPLALLSMLVVLAAPLAFVAPNRAVPGPGAVALSAGVGQQQGSEAGASFAAAAPMALALAAAAAAAGRAVATGRRLQRRAKAPTTEDHMKKLEALAKKKEGRRGFFGLFRKKSELQVLRDDTTSLFDRIEQLEAIATEKEAKVQEPTESAEETGVEAAATVEEAAEEKAGEIAEEAAEEKVEAKAEETVEELAEEEVEARAEEKVEEAAEETVEAKAEDKVEAVAQKAACEEAKLAADEAETKDAMVEEAAENAAAEQVEVQEAVAEAAAEAGAEVVAETVEAAAPAEEEAAAEAAVAEDASEGQAAEQPKAAKELLDAQYETLSKVLSLAGDLEDGEQLKEELLAAQQVCRELLEREGAAAPVAVAEKQLAGEGA
mmetsp:Transcript_81531/g.257138  ORF Transcript_81531/g.257138 Transcript_81531/m.257138 type:complete len:387 (-) Transcript_81531:30-1190(-)